MTDKPVQKLSNQIPSKLSEPEWNQVHETIVMLNLATAQIEYSMTDGDDSIDVLTGSFASMSEGIQTIAKAIESFAQFSDIDSGLHNQVTRQCDDLAVEMQKSIVAFQFYDKLVQRLSHARNSMTHLSDLIGDDQQRHSVDSWKKLQTAIRDAYTMENDRQLFDAILSGKSINDALEEMVETNKTSSDDDIELF